MWFQILFPLLFLIMAWFAAKKYKKPEICSTTDVGTDEKQLAIIRSDIARFEKQFHEIEINPLKIKEQYENGALELELNRDIAAALIQYNSNNWKTGDHEETADEEKKFKESDYFQKDKVTEICKLLKGPIDEEDIKYIRKYIYNYAINVDILNQLKEKYSKNAAKLRQDLAQKEKQQVRKDIARFQSLYSKMKNPYPPGVHMLLDGKQLATNLEQNREIADAMIKHKNEYQLEGTHSEQTEIQTKADIRAIWSIILQMGSNPITDYDVDCILFLYKRADLKNLVNISKEFSGTGASLKASTNSTPE